MPSMQHWVESSQFATSDDVRLDDLGGYKQQTAAWKATRVLRVDGKSCVKLPELNILRN